jgi:hypothetical protein
MHESGPGITRPLSPKTGQAGVRWSSVRFMVKLYTVQIMTTKY